ncbi:hypothetical protein [Bacillus sp. MRMR6]|uniref:hypothetical protein n=1 Tax=Bacillus sp. MRMR6 TaxID=1928617 RepID=UPI000A989E03|nr:hypothetical protein [Bacillus sp. MRMR6]
MKGVWEGLQRKIGIKEEGKEAVWLHELRQVIERIPQDQLIGVRNRALLVIGWAGALRRSEVVGLNVEDISKTRDGRLQERLHSDNIPSNKIIEIERKIEKLEIKLEEYSNLYEQSKF